MALRVPAGDITVLYHYLPLSGEDGTVQSMINYYIDKTEQITAISEIISLIDAAKSGDLGTRINVQNFSGEFKQLTEGINETLDAVIGPLNVAAEYMDRISKGDIPPIITDTYYGDFNEINNNLNTCIDAIMFLVEDTKSLTQAALQGELKTRADATRHHGDFKVVIEGVNATLDSIITPINEVYQVATDYADSNFSSHFDQNLQMKGDWIPFIQTFDRMSRLLMNFVDEITRFSSSFAKGDFTSKLRDDLNVRGDLVIVKDSLNQVSDNISNVLQLIGIKMENLSEHANLVTSGIDDVSQGANLIAKNAEKTRNTSEMSDESVRQVLRAINDICCFYSHHR
ncbi:MAG: HAMP domain-containing protein [Methanobacteriota archaeon]